MPLKFIQRLGVLLSLFSCFMVFSSISAGATDTEQLSSVSGSLWIDSDADGQRGDNEAALKNAVLTLHDTQDKVVATQNTGNSGDYTFSNLEPAAYLILVRDNTLPVELNIQTVDPDADKDNRHQLTVEADTAITGINFAYTGLSQLGGRAWHDLNADGIQDQGEEGISGVIVKLYSDPNEDGDPADGQLLDTVMTDKTGLYRFDDLLPASYILHFATPENYTPSPARRGDNAELDSHITASGHAAVRLTQAGDLMVDAGYHQYGSLGDFVWLDLNRDGLQGANEPGIQGIQVDLLSSQGEVQGTTTTDKNGYYSFDVPPGTWQIAVIAAKTSFVETGQGSDRAVDSNVSAVGLSDPVQVTPLKDDLQIDAGIVPGNITGYVMDDLNNDGQRNEQDVALPDVTLTVNGTDSYGNTLEVSTITDAQGQYQFSLPPGDYVLSEVQPEGYDSGSAQAAATLESTVINANQLSIKLTSGSIASGANFFEYKPASIEGVVTSGVGGNPRSGITITLYTDPNGDGDTVDGEIAGSAVTGTDGKYLFVGLIPGDYIVVKTDPEGGISQEGNRYPVNLSSGEIYAGAGFTNESSVMLSGVVYDDLDGDGDRTDADAGIAGVSLDLWSDPNNDGNADDGQLINSTESNAEGQYAFSDVASGQWLIVQHNKSGFVSTSDASGANDDIIQISVTAEQGKLHCHLILPLNGKADSCNDLYFMDRLAQLGAGESVQIPTLTQWALLLLSLLMIIVTSLQMRRQQ